MKARVLAFDFGASSGRAMLAEYDGQALSLSEAHRFDNEPITVEGHLHWNFSVLMQQVREGIRRAGAFDSVAVDTWGVDYGLLDTAGNLMGLPVHYRDIRTEGMPEKAFARMPAQALYTATGSQILPHNTLFQLLADRLLADPLLPKTLQEAPRRAATLLFMPDLFAYALCGVQACERTIASTSQMLDQTACRWREDVLSAMGIPASILLPVRAPGVVLGDLLPGYGVPGAKVALVAGHDTQSAIATIPFAGDCEAFLSCGTWSLLGTELDAPILTLESMRAGLSNELAAAHDKVDYLKNIVGLWLVQECRRTWNGRGMRFSYAQLMELAQKEQPLRSLVDPDDPAFVQPGDMPERIRAYCATHGQPVPETPGQVVRCIYESLALRYRHTLGQIARLTGRRFGALHVVGGGVHATLLCQMTADALGIPVLAGPAEATALGNAVLQLVALGALPDLAAGRALIVRSQQPVRYEPKDTGAFDAAYGRFVALL